MLPNHKKSSKTVDIISDTSPDEEMRNVEKAKADTCKATKKKAGNDSMIKKLSKHVNYS